MKIRLKPKTTSPSPSPSPSPTEVEVEVKAASPSPEEISFDSLLASCEQDLGQDLGPAMARLISLVEANNPRSSIEQIKEGFNTVNGILLADPSLVTEIMLPEHLGELCKAARAYTQVTEEAGNKRKTAKEKKAATDVAKFKIAAAQVSEDFDL